ncbi:hypothetical protein GCM10023191_034760 [Actinoallomurus oryzae]|uniref:p-aminobenzoate N-oxygenase AurF n=1 Tax=Actinoallomurus oryzae TaxID=502180 RepID=A0ABP8Q0A5_9ACTN
MRFQATAAFVPLVRDTIRDHARDEGRHHAFFAALFDQLWYQLDSGLKARVGRCLPELIRACLWPQTAPVRTSLRLAGLSAPVVERVIEASYPAEEVLIRMRRACRHSLRLFEGAGVLDVPGAREAFAENGLLTPGGSADPHEDAAS